jgi:hypothetical protein
MSKFGDWLRGLVRHRAHKGSGPREFTMNDVRTDPWSAIDLSIPAHAHLHLLKQARADVDDCLAQISDGGEGPAGDQKPIAARVQQAKERGAELDRIIRPREASIGQLHERLQRRMQDERNRVSGRGRGGRGR